MLTVTIYSVPWKTSLLTSLLQQRDHERASDSMTAQFREQ